MTSLLAFLGISLNPLTLAKDFAEALFNEAASLFGTGASALVTALLGFITTTSDPVLSGGWWSSSGQAVFDRVLLVSGSVLALAFMCSVITACISADHALLARAALRLPVAVIEMALLVVVVGALLSATDEVSAAIAKGATGDLSTFVAGSMADAVAGSGIVGIITGGIVILASLGVWAELLVRTSLIYVAVMAGPIIFAASVHPSVRGLKKRYVEGALALIFSKVVIALAFATGSALLSGIPKAGGFAASVGSLLEALTILLVACFSPFVLLKLLVGAEAIIATEGLERRPARAALHATGTATSLGGFAGMVRGIGSNGGPTPPGGASGRGPLSGGPPGTGPGSAPSSAAARAAPSPTPPRSPSGGNAATSPAASPVSRAPSSTPAARLATTPSSGTPTPTPQSQSNPNRRPR